MRIVPSLVYGCSPSTHTCGQSKNCLAGFSFFTRAVSSAPTDEDARRCALVIWWENKKKKTHLSSSVVCCLTRCIWPGDSGRGSTYTTSRWEASHVIHSVYFGLCCFTSAPHGVLTDQLCHDPCYSPLLTSPSILHLRVSCRAHLPTPWLTTSFIVVKEQ